MRRILLALVVLLHGLAHSYLAWWGLSHSPEWFFTALWSIAVLGYLSAGAGMLRVPLLRDWWKQLMVAATAASMLLLVLVGAWPSVAGAVFDLALLITVLEWAQPTVDASVLAAESREGPPLPHPLRHRIGWGLAALALAYVAAVVLLRPIGIRWGTTRDERLARLPGDELVPEARYTVQQAVTIHAPADSVWPWLAQIGQDRAGFYSYDRLERLAGLGIHNADRVHPEWQAIREGDLVRATPPGYLRWLGERGWRVAVLVPGRALVLRDWGTFAVEPLGGDSSRLVVRSRCECLPTPRALLAGPLNVLLFEPAHLVMQRRMLIGVRDRAERAMRLSMPGA